MSKQETAFPVPRFNFLKGDMVVFVETGEWCILEEQYRASDALDQNRLRWKTTWGSPPKDWFFMGTEDWGLSVKNLSESAYGRAYRYGSLVLVRGPWLGQAEY